MGSNDAPGGFRCQYIPEHTCMATTFGGRNLACAYLKSPTTSLRLAVGRVAAAISAAESAGREVVQLRLVQLRLVQLRVLAEK